MSRLPWKFLLGCLAVALALIGLAMGGRSLGLVWHTSLWAALIFTAAILQACGVLKLFGPVLFYDMVRLARRGRYFILRIIYGGLIIFIMFCYWSDTGWRYNREDPQQYYAALAMAFFGVFMWVQLIAICLLTPAYVGGAIAEEKERKTLEFMLATDLRNREIVLSKLVARLANLTLIIITGLPILSLLQFLGGIDPELLLAGFLGTIATMVSLTCYCIVCSVYFKKPRDAIACSYLGLLVYFVVGLIGFAMQESRVAWLQYTLFPDVGPSLNDAVNFLNAGHFLVTYIQLGEAFRMDVLQSVLEPTLRDYVTFHEVFSLVCIAWSVWRLRPIALRQSSETARKPGKWVPRWLRYRPAVSNSPVLWKEMHIEERGRRTVFGTFLVGILVLLTVGSFYPFFIMDGSHHYNYRDVNVWGSVIGAIVSCIILLGVAVRASSCIASERDKNTFDFLLTTPLDSDTILRGKFLGCLYSMRMPLLWLGSIWGIAWVMGGMNIVEITLQFLAVLIYAAAFTQIGMWFSMVCRSGTRATVGAFFAILVISVGHWLLTACCAAIVQNHTSSFDDLLFFQLGLTPPLVLGMLPQVVFDLRTDSYMHDAGKILAFCIIGLVLYAVVSVIFWFTVLGPRFRKMTHRD